MGFGVRRRSRLVRAAVHVAVRRRKLVACASVP